MADIKLGLTKDAIESARETYEGPRTPFPANKLGYTKYSATVTDLQIKQGTGKTEGKAWLWIQVSNGPYQESILVNLDPSDIAPSTTPDKVDQAVKRNLDTLLRAIKVLGISNTAGDGIDTNKLPLAIGTLISFGVKMGETQANGYPKYNTAFYGKAETLVAVEVSGNAFGKSALGSAGAPDDDIPF